MKITCQSCQAKYTIADEKVAGKTVKIKCKKCGSTIVVHGNDAAGAAPAHQSISAADPGLGGAQAPSERGGEEDGETRVFGQEGEGGGIGGDEWTVNITDDDQRTLTLAQLVAEYRRGVVTTDSYVWRDGMPDWLPLSSVPELVQAMRAQPAGPAAGAPRAPSPAPLPVPDPDELGLGGTMMMGEVPAAPSPFAARAPSPVIAAPMLSAAPAAPQASAARRPGARGGAVDLFAQERGTADSLAPGAERQIGERNENSVLFSLSALTATENAVRGKGKGDDSLLDLRSNSMSPSKNGGRAGLDDIMNLGGGGISAAPILAPPPLLAPVVEPPPVSMAAPPMSMAPVMGVPSYAQSSQGAAPQKKSPVVLIGVGFVLLALAAGGGAFFALRAPAPAPAVAAGDTAAAPTAVAAAPAATAGAVPAAPDPAAAAVTPGAATPTSAAVAPAASAKAAAGPATGAVAAGPAGAKGADTPPKTADTAKAAESAKAADPPAGGGKEFDRAAAMAALSAASGAAKGCKKEDGPTGAGKVKVTFAPSGNVTSAQVQGAPFAGTAVGGCVASAFRGARVPSFDGAPVTVNKSFTVN